MAFTFFANSWISHNYRLDSILCLVDAQHLRRVRMCCCPVVVQCWCWRPGSVPADYCSAAACPVAARWLLHTAACRLGRALLLVVRPAVLLPLLRWLPPCSAAAALPTQPSSPAHPCAHVPQHLEDAGGGDVNEAVNQIAVADIILLNKIDLVSPEELQVCGVAPAALLGALVGGAAGRAGAGLAASRGSGGGAGLHAGFGGKILTGLW